MNAITKKLIDVALSQVGYLEKKTNAQLDDFTANAGSNNFTKYGRDTAAWGLYNGNKNGFAWCDVFVDWCMVQAFGGDVKAAMAAIFQPLGGAGAGCEFSMQYFKNNGALHKTPQKGDQIFFAGADGKACHTGLVYEVDGSKVYTVEGNTSSAAGVVANGGCVAKKSYALNYAKILGYGRPNIPQTQESEEEIDMKYNTLDEIKRDFGEEVAERIHNAMDNGYITSKNGELNMFESSIRAFVWADRRIDAVKAKLQTQ